MAEANLGSDVDFGYLDTMNLTPEVKARIVESVTGKVKALHGGMTKAQQESATARRQVQERDAKLQKWDEWYTPNKSILDDWPTLGPLLHKHGTVKVRQVLSGDLAGADTVQKQAEAARAHIIDKWKGKEMTYEDMQAALGEVDSAVQTTSGDVQNLRSRFDSEIPQISQRYEQTVGALHQELTQLKRGYQQLFPLTVEAIAYQREHPERDVREVLKVATERGISNWQEAIKATYGENDFEELVNKRVGEKLAIEEENLKTKYAAQNGPGEGSLTGTPVGIFRRKKVERVATSESEVKERMADILNRQHAQ